MLASTSILLLSITVEILFCGSSEFRIQFAACAFENILLTDFDYLISGCSNPERPRRQ